MKRLPVNHIFGCLARHLRMASHGVNLAYLERFRKVIEMVPTHMLVKKGKVQRMVLDGRKLWPVFGSREDAAKFARLYGTKASPAEIGSVEGETLEGHIMMAIDEGCVAAMIVLSWNGDEANVGYKNFD